MGATRTTPNWKPCDQCEDAWRGLIEAKLTLEAERDQAERNARESTRLYAQWRARAEKAEADLKELRYSGTLCAPADSL
jgi:hypothetical protein